MGKWEVGGASRSGDVLSLDAESPPLFVLYVPGLDHRRLAPDRAPQIASLREAHPTVVLRTLPDVDLTPTLMTGTLPHEHGVWQVSLPGPRSRDRTLSERAIDLLPDIVSTTAQGIGHATTGDVDLAAIPPERRRRLKLHRFKYQRRLKNWLEPSERVPSIFSLLGDRQSRYHMASEFSELRRLVPQLPSADCRLEWLEFYGFDLAEHWNLDRPRLMDDALSRVDRAVGALRDSCRSRDIRFLLLSDHGQERVSEWFDLIDGLSELDVPDADYDYFMQPVYARFWFHTDHARRTISQYLSGLDVVNVRTYREMHEHGVKFESDAYGELYAYASPGTAFFPHDFHQPLANLYMGVTHSWQRPRIFDPRHRGCHGYLGESPSERGFLLCADDRIDVVPDQIHISEVAPALIRLAGGTPPAYMRDGRVFET